MVAAGTLCVGDMVKVSTDQPAPADLTVLYVTDKSDSIFIRTDQLDGETDWKPRRPLTVTQKGIKKMADVTKFAQDSLLCE